MKIASSLQNPYPMWFSEAQMEHSIKHNLNKCQLGPCFEAPILKHPNVYRDVAGKGD